MQKTVTLEWAEPGDEQLKDMDKSMEYEARRLEVLTRWARKHPDRVMNHINRAITSTTKKEFNQYTREIKKIGKRLEGEDGADFREHGARLTPDARGLTVYLNAKLEAMGAFAIAEAAGIKRSEVLTLIKARATFMFVKDKGADVVYSPKDPISNKIFGGAELNKLIPVKTVTKDGKKYGAVFQVVRYEDKESGTKAKFEYTNYGDFDRQVNDAVATLAAIYGVPVTITSEQIYRRTSQNPRARLTLKIAKQIAEAMRNCRQGDLTIITDPAGNKELWERGTAGKLRPERERFNVAPSYYGGLITYSGEISGKFEGVPDTWTIYEIPILYRYAHDKDQVASTPIKAVEASKPRARKDKSAQSIIGYITRRIDTMKKNPSQSRNILWENIYEMDGVYNGETQNPRTITTKQKRTRDKTIKMLDECVDRGLIKGYAYNDKEHTKLVGKTRQYYAIGIVF